MPEPKFDDWMDAQLRNVPVPRELLKRLRDDAPGSTRVDDQIDEALRDVPVPLHLQWNLRRIARKQTTVPGWLRFGLAASVLVSLTAGALAYLNSSGKAPVASGRTAIAKTVAPRPARTPVVPPISRPFNLPPGVNTVARESREREPLASDEPASEETPQLPFTFESVASFGQSLRQAAESRARTQAALGAGGELARLPRLDVLELPSQRGVTPPRLRGYDLLFQLRHGEHPFVSPGAHEELATSRLPLTFDTASYDAAARAIRGGQMPGADELRVEDFLAAQDYVLPKAPSDSLALHAAVARSPLGADGLHALQILVKAGAKKAALHPATRLIVLVDTSWSMADQARWETTHRALRKLAASMRPQDRVTLIGFAEHANMLAEDATAAQLTELIDGQTLAAPGGASRLSVGLQAAFDAAQATSTPEIRRVLLISPLDEDLDTSGDAATALGLNKLNDAKIPWQIVRLGAGQASEALGKLVSDARGQLASATSATQIHAALAQALTGHDALVASGASVKLVFNPKAVSGYRLVGHEAMTLTGEASDPLEIDLRAGDQLVGLYEMWIKPGSDESIATVELSWRDAASGQPRKAAHAIRRTQIAESFAGAPHWLQQGIVTAKAAEVLRGSHYTPASRPFGQLRDLAGQVDMQAARQPSFKQLVELIELAEKLR